MAAPSKKVSEREIRKLFASGKYEAKVESGEYQEIVAWQNHPAPPFLPFCTKSQMVHYINSSGSKVAIVHQYLKPDGTLGASGKPDPKFLFHNGTRYHMRAEEKH